MDSVTLYRAPTSAADADAIADWLGDRPALADVDVDVSDRYLDVHGDDDLPETFAESRVLDPYDRDTGNTMLGIVRYEERALDDPERAGGVLYDGTQVQDALHARIPSDERSLDHAHVVLLDRALGTWGTHDGRWHKRVAVLGQPALVSVPGLYEAPAKPDEYYQAKQRHALVSGDAPPREVLEEQVDGDFLVADDPRTTDCLKGYALAAVDYLRSGDAFCGEPDCRLANPHRQPGVVRAQLHGDPFCPDHADDYAH